MREKRLGGVRADKALVADRSTTRWPMYLDELSFFASGLVLTTNVVERAVSSKIGALPITNGWTQALYS